MCLGPSPARPDAQNLEIAEVAALMQPSDDMHQQIRRNMHIIG